MGATKLRLAPVVLALIAGCSSAPATGNATASRTPSPAPAEPTPAGNAQPQARAAYLGMWQAYVTASQTADYQSPALARYAAGGALSVLTHGLYQNHQNGIVTRGQPAFDPRVTITSPGGVATQASVTDCADSSHWGTYYHSGKPAPGEQRGKQRVYARLQPFDGTWKVTYLVVEKEGSC